MTSTAYMPPEQVGDFDSSVGSHKFGAGLLLEKEGRYLFVLAEEPDWKTDEQNNVRIYLSFPGGGREGDETPRQCAIRETLEEAGLQAEAETSATTLVFDNDGNFTQRNYAGGGPLAVQYFPPTPEHPQALDFITYRGRVLDEAAPVTPHDVPAALWLAPEQARKIIGDGLPLSNLLAHPETTLIMARPIPSDAVIYLPTFFLETYLLHQNLPNS